MNNGIRCPKNIIDNPEEMHLIHPNGDGQAHRDLISEGHTGHPFYRALQKQGMNTDGFVIEVRCKAHHYSLDMSGKKHYNYKEGKFNDPDWLREKYKIMTTQEIGDLCGVSHQTIGRRLTRFGHPKRKPGACP